MEKFDLNTALNEAEEIKKIAGKNPTYDRYELADKYVDDVRTIELKTEAEKRKKHREIQKFIVTRERWDEALHYYYENKDALIKAAIDARGNGVSHRNPPFQVGCAVLGIEPNGKENKYGVYKAYNFKVEPGPRSGKDKRCAERGGLEIAEKNAKVVAAVVIASKETNTGDPTKASNTLHPCQDCRMMYRHLLKKGFLRENTIICGVNDSNHEIISEESTLKALLDLYPDDLEKSIV